MKIFNVAVYGLDESIVASGYPMQTEFKEYDSDDIFEIDEQHMQRAEKLGNAKLGSGHDCFLKGIIVQFDIEYPQYWSQQVQRYHFIDFVSSGSKMHKASAMKINDSCNKYVDPSIIRICEELQAEYNSNPTKDNFQKFVASLPMGFMLTARMTTNYLQLKTIYNQRKNHKLLEWREFCDWIITLPMFMELCSNDSK